MMWAWVNKMHQSNFSHVIYFTCWLHAVPKFTRQDIRSKFNMQSAWCGCIACIISIVLTTRWKHGDGVCLLCMLFPRNENLLQTYYRVLFFYFLSYKWTHTYRLVYRYTDICVVRKCEHFVCAARRQFESCEPVYAAVSTRR